MSFERFHNQSYDAAPMSRTMQYRKVMKPLLERKRRARINRCLEELKELMIAALVTEGENAAKLEKADILELTVSHLHKLRKQQLSTPVAEADRFRAGYTTCAREVSKTLASTPDVDIRLGKKLMTHLGQRLNEMNNTTAAPLVISVGSGYGSDRNFTMPLSPPSSRGSPSPISDNESESSSSSSIWRPW
ncbi:enhancer of split m7 protein-like [Cylas formicarius]|uniref:enhancer of split m7 protein-like n=1 Tax=Cylas formicarius TaxID=197179 RepID=UPI00295843A6|nr:enhancer of split m7 protein-like [Cylas formicarius]